MPEVHVEVRNGLASVDVNELDINVERHTLLVLPNIRAYIFSLDICENAVSTKH